MKPFPHRPIIGMTMGDPLGIGPEILVKALSKPEIYAKCRPLVLGDANIILKAIEKLSLPIEINLSDKIETGRYIHGIIDMINLSDLAPEITRLTSPTREVGEAMEKYILTGVDLALENKIAALVTGPITKTGLKAAGSRFHGHTEMIAHRTGSLDFSMMLAGKTLKVVLVTIHIPVSLVPQTLSQCNVLQTIELTWQSLKYRFGIQSPRLAVAGLNPHAGEEGLFGNEEKEIIAPAVEAALDRGIDIQGPIPPDTVFCHAVNGRFDAVVCMYHDQGLIPFKLVHFKDGVNTTLGLPIIRTSVDHGTAYDIAWQGIADPSSLTEAINMAILQASNKKCTLSDK